MDKTEQNTGQTKEWDNEQAKAHIIRMAKEVGFDLVRITDPHHLDRHAAYFQQFLDQNHHGDMAWLMDKADRRKDPKVLWSEAQSIIMLAMNYGPNHNPLARLDHADRGNISVYAKGKDYHDVIKKKLKQIARMLHQSYGAAVKVFVDTAPVMEKPLAQKAGLGWQGKHSNLVSRDFGNWLFLGSIFTTLPLTPDAPESDHCGRCRQCLDICPTQAFPAPYRLDARRCLSYLTIEYKGHIDQTFRKAMGNRIYGCDDCLAVCPWNKYARPRHERAFLPRIELDFPRLADLVMLDDTAFRKFFSGSPIKRIGRDYFIRNVLIAIGNSQDRTLIPSAETQISDPSPYVRAMAVWALSQLSTHDQWRQLKTDHYADETDPAVKKEWEAVDSSMDFRN